MIRVGILGAGRHSTAAHGPALKILQSRRPDQIKLSAVCDLNLARAESFAAGSPVCRRGCPHHYFPVSGRALGSPRNARR